MNTNERVLELLNSNDLDTKNIEGSDKYHMFSVGVVGHDDISLELFFVESDDDDMISFCSAGLYEYGDDDFVAVLNAMNEMSIKNPFVKPVIIGENSIWLYYDHKLFNQEVTIEMIRYIISTLASFGLNLLNKIDEYKAKMN